MKFKSFSIPFVSLVLTAFIFSACTKEGPAGPAGAAGPQGPAGPAGGQGPAGPAGTANVYYSDWLDVTFEPEVDGTDTVGWAAQIAAPRLVDSILARGEVRVYTNINTEAEPLIVALPLDAALFGGFFISPLFRTGTIALISNGDASTFTEDNEKSFQYRYIIIPGGTSVQGLAGRANNINWNNYAEVQKHLSLKD